MPANSLIENLTDDVFSADDNYPVVKRSTAVVRKSVSDSSSHILGTVASGTSEIHNR